MGGTPSFQQAPSRLVGSLLKHLRSFFRGGSCGDRAFGGHGVQSRFRDFHVSRAAHAEAYIGKGRESLPVMYSSRFHRQHSSFSCCSSHTLSALAYDFYFRAFRSGSRYVIFMNETQSHPSKCLGLKGEFLSVQETHAAFLGCVEFRNDFWSFVLTQK